MLGMYGKARHFGRLRDTKAQLLQSGLAPTIITFGTLLTHYAVAGQVEEVLALHKEMQDFGLEPHLGTEIHVVGVLGRAGMLSEMQERYGQCKAAGLVDAAMLTVVIKWHARSQQWDAVCRLEAEAVCLLTGQNAAGMEDVYAALVLVYGEAHRFADVESVLRRMGNRTWKVYDALIKVYAGTNHPQRLLEVERDMAACGIAKDEVMRMHLVRGYTKAFRGADVLRLWDDFRAEGDTNAKLYARFLSAFGTLLLLDRVGEVQAAMRTAGVDDDGDDVLTALLLLYGRGLMDLTEVTALKARVFRKERKVAVYNALIDACGACGCTDVCEEVTRMWTRGLGPALSTICTIISAYGHNRHFGKIRTSCRPLTMRGWSATTSRCTRVCCAPTARRRPLCTWRTAGQTCCGTTPRPPCSATRRTSAPSPVWATPERRRPRRWPWKSSVWKSPARRTTGCCT